MTTPLEGISQEIVAGLERTSAARETGLANSRQATRRSANAIRALHRGETDTAADLISQARSLLDEARQVLEPFPQVRWAGFVHDGEKEYAEASLYDAVVRGRDLPTPDDLGVTGVAWLHGVAETVGELRRAVLDRLRHGRIGEAEDLFATMERMYEVLLVVDFPDSMTSGLRRAADASRAISERTRSDLSLTAVQHRLEVALAARDQASEQ